MDRERSGRETSYRLQQREADINAYVQELVKGFGRHVEWDGVWTIVSGVAP